MLCCVWLVVFCARCYIVVCRSSKVRTPPVRMSVTESLCPTATYSLTDCPALFLLTRGATCTWKSSRTRLTFFFGNDCCSINNNITTSTNHNKGLQFHSIPFHSIASFIIAVRVATTREDEIIVIIVVVIDSLLLLLLLLYYFHPYNHCLVSWWWQQQQQQQQTSTTICRQEPCCCLFSNINSININNNNIIVSVGTTSGRWW